MTPLDERPHNVMLDLETMSSGSDAAIVAIGAVLFNPDTGVIGEKFYRRVDLRSSVAAGGVMDPDTVLWWLKQDDAARLEITKEGSSLEHVLSAFCTFLAVHSDWEKVKVWGNGSDFDNVILANAYKRLNLNTPWRFYNNRCFRTTKAGLDELHPDVRAHLRDGLTAHNAVDDAIYQTRYLLTALGKVIQDQSGYY